MANLSKVTTAMKVVTERDQLKAKLKSNNEMIKKTTLQHEQNSKRIKAKVQHLEVNNEKLVNENESMKVEFEKLRLQILELQKQTKEKDEVDPDQIDLQDRRCKFCAIF